MNEANSPGLLSSWRDLIAVGGTPTVAEDHSHPSKMGKSHLVWPVVSFLASKLGVKHGLGWSPQTHNGGVRLSAGKTGVLGHWQGHKLGQK